MKLITKLFRYLTGAIFAFSGIVKLIDPVGTQIKLEEYFEVFAADFTPLFHYLVPAALTLSVVLSTLEVVLGVALLVRYRVGLVSGLLLLLVIFFGFLTFYSAYFDKVTDCGCFGDFVKLTPWQSFWKDMVLLLTTGWVWLRREQYVTYHARPLAVGAVFATGVAAMALAIYAVRHLPPVDFRPYRVGASIPGQMEPSEALTYHYVMERDGRQEVFATYPDDPAYEYKDMILTNPGALPKISDYSVWNDEGDFTQASFEGNKLMVIVQTTEGLAPGDLTEISALISALDATPDLDVWLVTSADAPSFEHLRHEAQLAAPYYFADATVLKTIVRSNPGILLLEEGVVRGKWHYHDVPTAAEVNALLRPQG